MNDSNKNIENYFDFLMKQKEIEEKTQSDYIDQLIEENSG